MWYKLNKSKSYQKFSQKGRWKERLGFITTPHFKSKPIWIHSVSVGEFIAVLPLIHDLLNKHPEIPLFITTTTQTGSDLVLQKLSNKVFHSYIPWDLPDAISRFYHKINPRAVLIMETEIWPNLLMQGNKKAIPLFLINARMSEKSFKSYQKIAAFTKKMLGLLTYVCVQNNADLERFSILGLKPSQASITGNLKFDLTHDQNLIDKSEVIKYQLNWSGRSHKKEVLLVSSTHDGEDELMLNLYQNLKKSRSELTLVLIPRHPERFQQVYSLAKKILPDDYNILKRSALNNMPNINHCEVLIGDSLGEMTLYYSLCDIVIMGGTFIKHGGHNTLEPALLAKPIFYGPSMYNFAAINHLFLARKASVQVKNINELEEKLNLYLKNPQHLHLLACNAKELMDENSGSKEMIYKKLEEHGVFKH